MPKHILVVEDQTDVRELIRATLEMEDHHVHEAQDGAEALAAIRQGHFDFVLLDVRMPGPQNGLDVCTRVKSAGLAPRTKIVMLTACDRPADHEAGRRAGADSYLTKPFSPRELLELVASVR